MLPFDGTSARVVHQQIAPIQMHAMELAPTNMPGSMMSFVVWRSAVM
jgi:hypothetical protein